MVTSEEALRRADAILAKAERAGAWAGLDRQDRDLAGALRKALAAKPALIDEVLPYMPARDAAEE